MKVYLVGGAVRDKLLGRPILERDYVVVGATIRDMLKLGYQQVGKDFPVFLHPQSKDEHALARTERKQGQGYTGFICDFAPTITLEDDLIRRDLTVNAIAEDDQGNLIDPYKGKTDLDNKVLRHVSSAFSEDPLRVLRVARFAARYAYLGFSIADETTQLMNNMVAAGELETLTKERVWMEIEKSLKDGAIQIFANVLSDLDALPFVTPWLSNWDRNKASAVSEQLARLDQNGETYLRSAFSLWQYQADLSGYNLEQDYKIPSAYADSLRDLQANLPLVQSKRWCAETIMKVFNQLDAWRRPEKLSVFINSARVIDDTCAIRTKLMEKAYEACKSVKAQEVIALGAKGPEIRIEMDKLKLKRIEALLAI
ncbi:tRNA nucleotidyltransferase [Pseudoalteromonas luteoviolacea]|uniref:tRNA nucleotidyltransferase n=1 Tax=Pseudoalteromonas luteoviolacea TaxID=43657 RepID=UPI001B377DE3|nr:tRNA nucleotidyltransferase [Pseudoalteromonas luteoviolacea]MBQ4811734.1 tRNA nucleotidyltransferase [Pseudoalteromonas luteoviolacea]